MKRNENWIKAQIKNGREIIDIGPDFQRRAVTGRSSQFYEMERRNLNGYYNYKRAFERNNNQTGVPGLDF
jgi:5-methylcytosine-specific restriction endonuclease McrBC regulatory subunit McrC